MRRKMFYGVMLVAMLVVFQTPLRSDATEVPAVEIVNAASEGVGAFLEAIPEQDLRHFGFADTKAVKAAVIGKGFHVYTVPPDAVLDNGTADMSTIAEPTTMWEFLITSEGKGAAMLTVDKMEGKWVAVSIGAAALAGQLGEVLKIWPEAGGYEQRLIRSYQASSDFIEISQKGRPMGFVPMGSARAALGLSKTFDPAELLDSATVMKKTAPAVRSNMGVDNAN